MKLLADDDFEGLLYCVNELIDRRRRAGVQVPQWMERLSKKMDLTSAMSAGGHLVDEKRCSEEQLAAMDMIGSRQAAELLGVTPRQARRMLPARTLSGRRVYAVSDVMACAQRRLERKGKTA